MVDDVVVVLLARLWCVAEKITVLVLVPGTLCCAVLLYLVVLLYWYTWYLLPGKQYYQAL